MLCYFDCVLRTNCYIRNTAHLTLKIFYTSAYLTSDGRIRKHTPSVGGVKVVGRSRGGLQIRCHCCQANSGISRTGPKVLQYQLFVATFLYRRNFHVHNVKGKSL
jgi:hypothetical protein